MKGVNIKMDTVPYYEAPKEEVVTPKRGRGRPKGSKNKPKPCKVCGQLPCACTTTPTTE